MSTSLGKMPSRENLSYLFDSETKSIKLLMEMDIFKIERKCIYCPYGTMVQNGGSLRCKKCFKRCSYLKGTFFEQLKLPISKILELGYYWLNNIRVTSLRNIGGISNQTSCNYFEKFQNLVSKLIENENIKIGGPGIIVEIDESKFGKRKYNRGHRVIGSWVISGVERTDEKNFLQSP